MKIIIKRAVFNAEDFNTENNCRQYGSAQNLGDFVAIEIADHALDAFKETLRETYANLDAEYEDKMAEEQHYAEQLMRRQMMIRQIITKMVKPE